MASRVMQRNNTIIGLSDIMVVVEAGETGGSLDAGNKTLMLTNTCLYHNMAMCLSRLKGITCLFKRVLSRYAEVQKIVRQF